MRHKQKDELRENTRSIASLLRHVFFSIRVHCVMMISYLVLPQKKVCLSAWNFTIRDSVLGLCGLLEPLLKGQMGVSARRARVKGQERLSHFYWGGGVLWPRSFSGKSLAFLPVFCPSLRFLKNSCLFCSLKISGTRRKMGRGRRMVLALWRQREHLERNPGGRWQGAKES